MRTKFKGARTERPIFDVDMLAARLGHSAWLAKSLGPAWEKGGRMSYPYLGQLGEPLGAILPGKGLLIDTDLKKVGINRPIPFVYERSPLMRLLDKLRFDEVGAITTYDGIVNARAGGKAEDVVISLSSMTTASGFWYDLWKAGGNPAAGSYLATTAPTDRVDNETTTGAWSGWLTVPSGSDHKYLIAMGWGSSSAAFMGILVDQLTSSGSFRTTVTSAETIASPTAVTRQYGPTNNLGTGAQICMPVQTARTTPTTSTLTISYRDQANNAHTQANAMVANADPVNRLVALPNTGSPFAVLNSGDFGVRRLDGTTKASSADAAGVLAGNVVQPLMFVPGIAANLYIERDAPMNIDGLIDLPLASSHMACLKMLLLANASSSGALLAWLRTCAG